MTLFSEIKPKTFKLIFYRIPDICANILLLKIMAATNFVF